MRPGEPITIHKRDATGREVLSYPARVLKLTPASITVEAVYAQVEVAFYGLHLNLHDRLVETFYNDRGYNVFEVRDSSDGSLKGWYCNITRPATFREGHVEADDLALDLIVLPDGSMSILDTDEFDVLDLSEEEKQRAWKDMEALRALAGRREGPFAREM